MRTGSIVPVVGSGEHDNKPSVSLKGTLSWILNESELTAVSQDTTTFDSAVTKGRISVCIEKHSGWSRELYISERVTSGCLLHRCD
jgi:hypothetical protein